MSNPTTQSKKFNLSSFAGKLNETQKKFSEDTAPRRNKMADKPQNVKDIVAMTRNTDFSSLKATNQFMNSMAQRYKHTTASAEYLAAASNWTYDERFAVWFRRPDAVSKSLTKSELMAKLSRGRPADSMMLKVGFNDAYYYAPMYTAPYLPVWTTFCATLPEAVLMRDLKQVAKHVWLPPQLTNMVNKIAASMAVDVKCSPAFLDALHQVRDTSYCDCNDDIEYFNKLSVRMKTSDKLISWMSTAWFNTSSPAFPWSNVLKSNGERWGKLGASNEPLLMAILSVVRRIIVLLSAAVQKQCLTTMSDIECLEKAWNIGVDLYNQVYREPLAADLLIETPNASQSKIASLTSHIIWLMSSGHIKPVAYEDIQEGKPDRSVYQSSGVLRVMMSKTGQMMSNGWRQESHLEHFGWQQGGAMRVVQSLLAQGGDVLDSYDLTITPTMDPSFGASETAAQSVVFDRVCFAAPDIKAQDQHFHPLNFTVAYDVLRRDFLQHLKDRLVAYTLNAVYAFYNSAEIRPLIMTNSGIVYTGEHLNPSGGNLTSLHSQNNAAAIGILARKFDFTYQPPGKNVLKFKISVCTLNKGDDSLYAFKCDKPIGDLVSTYAETTEAFVAPESQEKRIARQAIVHNNLVRFAKFIQKDTGMELKSDTLTIVGKLSDMTFLGYNIYAMPEMAFGVQAFVAARPLWRAIFTTCWGSRNTGMEMPPQLYAALRCWAAAYDVALVYPTAFPAFSRIYDALYATCKSSSLKPDDMEYTDLGDTTLPELISLPSTLPSIYEIFEWMTGFSPQTSRQTRSVGADGDGALGQDEFNFEGLEELSDPEEVEVSSKKIYKTSDAISTSNVEAVYDFENIDEQGYVEDEGGSESLTSLGPEPFSPEGSWMNSQQINELIDMGVVYNAQGLNLKRENEKQLLKELDAKPIVSPGEAQPLLTPQERKVEAKRSKQLAKFRQAVKGQPFALSDKTHFSATTAQGSTYYRFSK